MPVRRLRRVRWIRKQKWTSEREAEERASEPLESVAASEPLAPQVGSTSGDMPHMIRALRNRDFRWFWGGNFLSNIGTWMQNVAMGWLVLQLATDNPAFWLGVVGFASSAPMLAFSLLGGVIADRINRRKLMLVTQSAMMIFAFILWGLTALHRMTLPLLVLISFTTGIAMALNNPSYQALVPQLVPREDLANAIALNAAQFNMSRVVGPTLGGFAMAWFGMQGNFLLNALSFVAVLVALSRISYPPLYPAEKNTMWEDLKEGSALCLRAQGSVHPAVDDGGRQRPGDPLHHLRSALRQADSSPGRARLRSADGRQRRRRIPGRRHHGLHPSA